MMKESIAARKKRDPVFAYWYAKSIRARQNGHDYMLTLSDIHFLLYMARISIKQIGQRSTDYCLARLGDSGGYTRGNCRFITVAENLAERVAKNGEWTPERKRAASERAKKQQPWKHHNHAERKRGYAGRFTARD